MGTHRRARRTVGLAGLLTLLVAIVLGAGPAAADPPYTTEATITGADFTDDSTESGSLTELNLTWELPNHPEPTSGFVIDLPPELAGRTDTFPITDASGTVMGECTVTKTQLFCDLDSDYLDAHPRNISGTASFWVKVKTEVTEETLITYEFDDVEADITVTPPPGACTDDCDFNGRGSYKWGTYDPATQTVYWRVVIQAPRTGMSGGQEIKVVDEVDENQTITQVQVRATDELVTDANGKTKPGNYQVVDPGQYTVSDDLSTVTFTSEQGYHYVVDYITEVTDGGASAAYTNAAEITIANQTTRTVEGRVENQGGAGTGSGTGAGTFTITKEVVGDTAAVADLTFTGTYEVATPDGDVVAGTFEVTDGETWHSEEFDAGSVVTLTEVVPTEPENVRWADPVFSENGFTLGNGTTAVTLTNEATVLTGSFSVVKTVTGEGADLVDEDATFTVAYSYPAGPGYEAGSGELVVAADGTAVSSSELPAGAVVTLTEQTPTAVDGLIWGEPEFSTDTVTIGADEVVEVDLTNPTSLVPPEDPSDPADPGDPGDPADPGDPGDPADPVTVLAHTGAQSPSGALVGGVALVVSGAVLLLLRRRDLARR